MRKALLFVVATITVLPLFAQKDTIVYFNSLNRSCDKTASDYCITIKKSGNGTFSQTEKKVNRKFERLNDPLRIVMVNDSISDIVSKRGFKHPRIFQKCDSGYFISETSYFRINKGFSKCIFPIIKTGKWLVYDEKTNALISEEFYEDNELVSNKNWEVDGKPYVDNVFIYTETPVLYNGDKDYSEMNLRIAGVLRYPDYAVQNGISGKVILQFVVKFDGNIDGVRVLRGVYDLLDKEAIRAVKSIPQQWTPATIRGKPVNAFVVFPIEFKVSG
jgi:TonB family protein